MPNAQGKPPFADPTAIGTSIAPSNTTFASSLGSGFQRQSPRLCFRTPPPSKDNLLWSTATSGDGLLVERLLQRQSPEPRQSNEGECSTARLQASRPPPSEAPIGVKIK